jgi:hypothetical protein
MIKRNEHSQAGPIALVAVVAIVAIGAFCVLYARSTNRAGIESEVAKGLIQLFVVLLLGATVNEALKARERRTQEIEKERDRQRQNLEKENERQQKQAERLAVFRETIRRRLSDSYQAVKRSRGIIRTAGITPETLSLGIKIGATPVMTAYRCQLEALNETQLDLEKLWHELDCFRGTFTRAPDLIRRIKLMSGYLRRLVDEYEANCSVSLREDGVFLYSELGGLVASTKDSKFKNRFCDVYSEAVNLISEDLLSPGLTGVTYMDGDQRPS